MSETRGNANNAANYIRENFQLTDRLAVVVLNRRTHSVIQRISAAETIMGRDFQDWLRQRNQRDRCDVYISMNALHPNSQGRTKQDVATIRHVYLDFDMDGAAAVQTLRKREDLPKPNYLINTSPNKWQVIWKVAGFGKEEAEVLQRALAQQTGADPAATDIARVLRLPGFYNQKYAKPYQIKVDTLTSEVYGANRFPGIQTGERWVQGEATAGRRRRPRGPLSQSERDWAYAKRALARGESPAMVAAAIASYRRFDKHNPQYYADLTVRKAGQVLEACTTDEGSQEPHRA